jgi:superfamily II DNA or RNA helicase
METIAETLNDFGFIFFGIYIDAFKNTDGELKKRALLPNKWDEIKESVLDVVWDKNYGCMRAPNAVAINTELSNISTIDVDKPDECMILDKLLNECKFYVKTKKGYHFYFKSDPELPRRKMCGVADINTHLLYLCPEYQEFKFNTTVDTEYKSKTGKMVKTKKYVGYELVGQKYKYEIIKCKKLVKMSDEIKNWCKQMMLTGERDVVKREKKEKDAVINDINFKTEIFNITQMKCIYDIFFGGKLFDKYDSWRDIAYISRHLNNSEECFKLFDKYCRKVSKYANAEEIDNRIAFFGNNEYEEKFEYGWVLHKCKKLNKDKFNECLGELYVKKELDSIKINTKFIYIDENKKYFDSWMTNYKVMMIKSGYGTGKTKAFKTILADYDPKRVLFITYRQSLAWSLLDELKEDFGFDSYQNRDEFEIKKQERLIIQLDSIHLLRGKVNMFTNKVNYPEYDLVVLDEVESLLNHLSWSKIDQLQVEHILQQILIKSKKVLCLDGDLGNRSVDYVDSIFPKEYFILENKYLTVKKHFRFTNNKGLYDEEIEEALKNGKKIVIVSMSAKECEVIREKYDDKYNVVIHNGIEKNKKKLLNVNKQWKKADILVYSPVVEAGVDFTEIHFDLCFGLLSSDSTSYRAFLQMLNRVRNYKENNICVYTGGIQFKEYDAIYTYNDVEAEIYNDFEKTPLIKTMIHNKVEQNNTKSYFIPCLLQMIKDKGHTFEYFETKKNKRVDKDAEYNKKDKILEARDIDMETLTRIIKNEEKNIDNIDDYYAKEKMLYKIRWLIDELDEETFDKIYNKNYVLKNYVLMNIEERDVGKYDYLKKIKFDKIDNVKSLIACVDDGVIDYKRVNKLMNSKKWKTLFSTNKQVVNVKTAKGINSTLENYGYKITSKKHNKKVDGKAITTYSYEVNELDIIKEYKERLQAKEEAENMELILAEDE